MVGKNGFSRLLLRNTRLNAVNYLFYDVQIGG